MDVAGVLAEVGDGVTSGVAVGDHVMGVVMPRRTHGAYREDIVLPARSVVKAPAGASHAEASTLPMNGLTAVAALDLLDLRPDQVLVVTGAAGVFGGYVVQLAKIAGLTVIADASEPDEDLVRALGADIVVRRGPDFADGVRKHFRDGGAMATVRRYHGDGQRGLRIMPVSVRDYREAWEELDRLRQLAEKGKVTLRVADTYPAERAADAHRRFEAGGVRGRLVLLF
jgi:NADPH:quinone reductase-like Zn-dependent oxidoreductase